MQGKEHPAHREVELFSESVSTPGTEVAPRSHVVREHLQDEWVSHQDISIGTVASR